MPRTTIAAGLILSLLSLFRGVMLLRFEQFYAPGPQRWRRLFFFLHCVQRLVWATFAAINIYRYGGESFNTALVCLFTLGLCSLSLSSLSSYGFFSRLSLSISILPLITALILFKTTPTYLLSLICVGFYYSFLKQSQSQYYRFWHQIQTIEQLKESTHTQEASKRSAEISGNLKAGFLANLTREIRTPMNSLMGMLSLLGDTVLNEEQTEYQTVASDAGENLLELIDDVLDFSQLITGEIVLESKVFNLRKSIGEVLELQGPVAHAKGLEIDCVIDKRIPLRVRGDQHRLMQVINNLVSNAIKFSDKGEIILEVHMTTVGEREGLLRIHVIDQGIGVSKLKQQTLFENYLSLSEKDSPNLTGAGLGLAISKGLAQRMGGDIGVISEEGLGSTFWFTSTVRYSTQQAEQSFHTRSVAGKKVLIVSSTIGCAKSLVYEFENWGLLCEEINDHDKALQVLRTTARDNCRHDLVVLNLSLASHDILDLSRIIAEDPALKGLKQIMLTSLVQRGSARCVKHKNDVEGLEYLTKPVLRDSLWKSLSNLFNIHKDNDNRIDIPKNSNQEPITNHKNILLVEDNKVNQVVAKGMLTSLGYVVKVVNNGQEALGILEDKQFDLVLMDCLMPELDGYATTQEIRRREKNSTERIPIIAMTANCMDGDEAKCLASGMDDYLSKPVKIDKLDLKLKHWLTEKSSSGVVTVQHHKI